MAQRLDLDHPNVARWATRGMALLAVVGFATGAFALFEVGHWAGLGVAAIGVPIVLDLGLVLMAISATIARVRGAKSGVLWLGTAVLTSVSLVAQAVHASRVTQASGSAFWVAVVIGACPPVVTLWATEAWIRLVISEPKPRRPIVAAELSDEPPVRRARKPGSRTQPVDRDLIVSQAQELLNAGVSIRAAGAQLGVSRSSLTRWLAQAGVTA